MANTGPNRCKICNRRMFDSDNWQDEMHLDCGGDCKGCILVPEGRAVYRDCSFHGYRCVVRNHHADSTHLCPDARCIENQDITTLMLNASWARYKEGGDNELFNRLLQAAAEGGLTHLP